MCAAEILFKKSSKFVNVLLVSSNENKLSDRRRKRAVLRISMLKLSCGNFLAGRRFAGAHG